ncbi:MAG: alpha/beta hydrolase [Parcubacteria group bacterium]|jgi:hypothetical protein
MSDKILLLPGWMTGLKLYHESENLSVQIGTFDASNNSNHIIGLSLGALSALRDWDGKGKLILVSPPLPRKNIFRWFLNWVKFISTEGLFFERQKYSLNPFCYILEIVRCVKLLQLDFSQKLESIPKENLIMIRGKNDHFICSDEAVQFMRAKGFSVIEVENCGHNWCEELEREVIKC